MARIDPSRFVVIMLFVGLACVLVFVLPVQAQLPDTLQAGTRVEVEGKGAGTGSVRAEEVEIQSQRGGKDTLKGRVRTVEPEARTLTLAGVKIVASDATLLEGPDREPVSFSEFRPGQRLKAEGVFGQDGLFAAERLTVRNERSEKADEVVLEGPVQQVDPGSQSFTVFGVRVMVTPRTALQRERN
jgi:hypothetical protein